MKSFNTFVLILTGLVAFQSCSPDDLPKQIENELEEPEEPADVRLTSISVTNNGNTSSLTIVYDGNIVDKMYNSSGGITDTTDVSYNGDSILLYNQTSTRLNLDTILLSGGKPSEFYRGVFIAGEKKQHHKATYLYTSNLLIKYIRSEKTFRSISMPTPIDNRNYLVELVSDTGSIKDFRFNQPAGLVGNPQRVHFHYTGTNVDSIIVYEGLTYGSGMVNDKYIVSRSANIETFERYLSGNVYTGKIVVEKDPISAKIVKITKYDASNQIIYTEVRTYASGEANYRNVLINTYPYDNFLIGDEL